MPSSNNDPSPQELVRLIANDPLLSSIDRSFFDELQDELSWVALSEGETLFREGDAVDAFYFVISGLLEVSRDQEDQDGNPENDRLVLAEIGPDSTIGEMQILTGGVRTATVSALAPSGLVKFPKEAFDAFLAKDQNVVDALAATIMPRLYRDQMVDVLPKLFGELDDDMLRDLEAKMTWRSLRRGDLLCYQGEPSDSFYIIISGRLQVLITVGGKSRVVTEMSQGESVGEMGVVTGQPRSATIIASRDSELLEFSREEFEDFTQRYPEMMRRMTRLLINRLQRASRQSPVNNLSANILIAPASEGVALNDFIRQLYDALQTIGAVQADGTQPCLLLTSQEVDRRLALPGISQTVERRPDDLRLRSWLSEQERKYGVILLQADTTVTNWTRRCIRNADEIMYVAEAASEPMTTAVVAEVQEQEAKHAERRYALILLHDDDAERPQGTLRWLEKLNLARELLSRGGRGRHFHVRRQQVSDFQRLARYLSGCEVGLVLSGGGARGFAHVGCIRAMRELGIPIDMIGGVSMGSLVSAAYAYDPDRFEETIQRVESQLKGALFDITPPIVSIARGRRFDRRLRGWFGAETRIEDLWMPYFCLSSNLTEAQIVVHESGPLWWSVRASGTLPGLSSPVVHQENLLFDGCLLDNLPMDVMRERMGGATVIAVDVVPPHDLKFEFPDVQSPSGWWLLFRKLNPFAKTIALPNIVAILHRAGELGSVYGRKKLIDEKIADCYIQPRVEHIAITDFDGVGEARQIGYQHCKAELESWWPAHQAEKSSGAIL